MPEERKGQSAGMAYATKAAAEGVGSFRHQFRTEIRHFAALDIAPDSFGRIEVGRIAGEPLDLQPVALIPDENHALAANEAFELLEKIDEAGRVETILLGAGK